MRKDNADTVAVTAYSYSAHRRTDFVTMMGGDGKLHSVPVHWIEYLPEQKTTLMTVHNIGLSNTEYLRRIGALGHAPENATCHRGIFAYTSTPNQSTEAFINSLT